MSAQDVPTEGQTNGFPAGYFVIRSVGCDRLLDVSQDSVEDGTEVILWPATETALVESRRNPNSNNQVFFMDTSGALCSRSSGHAIDVEGMSRRMLSYKLTRHRWMPCPAPQAASLFSLSQRVLSPASKFSYIRDTGEIRVEFSYDPSYSSSPTSSRGRTYLLSSIPARKPRSFVDEATLFLSSTLGSPLSIFTGQTSPQLTPEDVSRNGVDLDEEEVLEEERGEEAEVDDSPELGRSVKVLSIHNREAGNVGLIDKARRRRRWQVIPLRTGNARTSA